MVYVFNEGDHGPVDYLNLKFSYFFDDPNRIIDHSISDGNVK